MDTKKLIQLSESMAIFSTISGQLEFALMLHDEYCNKTLPAYHSGKFPHPFTMLAEEKILIELDNFDHESSVYGKLMRQQVPPEYAEFKKRLKKEGWAKTIRNQLIAHKRRDKSGKFVPIKQVSQIVIVYRGRGPIEPRFCKNRLDKSCNLGYCRVDEYGQGIERQS